MPATRTAPDFTKPMGDWKNGWKTALKAAGLKYRFYDLRHTFVTRLAENPAVSEQTITALAGHVSKRMLEHYSRIRVAAKRAAIECARKRKRSRVPTKSSTVDQSRARIGICDSGESLN
jgi:integrase